MGIGENAAALHGEGYNCAQCVLCACGSYTELERDKALAVSCGFGGGVRSGEICGAISGAVMAIGLSVPGADSEREAMMKVASMTKKLTAAFRERYGAVRCFNLKQAGVSCDELIAFGAESAEKIIKEERGE